MFERANLGQVTWPTPIYDRAATEAKGEVVKQPLLVRYRVFTRAERKAMEREQVQSLASKARELMVRKEGETLEQHTARVETETQRLIEDMDARDARREQELLSRVLGYYQGSGSSAEFVPFEHGQLHELLAFDGYHEDFWNGLREASRGAAAKN